MYYSDHLGVAASGFMCSSTTCQGTTPAAQTAFHDLQTQINRVGVVYGLTRIDVDGKIGPTTLRVLLQLAARVTDRLGRNADQSLYDLLIEIDGQPVATVHEIALNAEKITAALQRDGAAIAPWTTYTAARNAMSQIINAGAASPLPMPPAAGAHPPDPYGVTPSNAGQLFTPATGNYAVAPPVFPRMPAGWQVWALAIGGAAIVVTIGLLIGRHSMRTA